MKLATQIQDDLQHQPDVGQHYSFIQERWKMYYEDDDFGRIFAGSAVCSDYRASDDAKNDNITLENVLSWRLTRLRLVPVKRRIW